MPVMALSCLFSLTPRRWPTSPCHGQRNCCPIGCCAIGEHLPTPATLPHGPNRRLSARSSTCLFGHATLITLAGWSWTWQCVHMLKWEPGTICVISGTNWASTSEGRDWAGWCWLGLHLNISMLSSFVPENLKLVTKPCTTLLALLTRSNYFN